MPTLLILIMLLQGIPALPGAGGTVSGIVRSATGVPTAGIRVAAVALPDPADPGTGSALVSLTETDSEGRYRLENIPPGRYYIIAGRVDLPTYHPGTLDVATGTVLAITPGSQLPGIDFAIREQSAGRAVSVRGVSRLLLPAQVRVEGGGKVPVIDGDHYPVIRLAWGANVTEVPLNQTPIALPLAAPGSANEYRVTVEDLPEGYTAKSVTFGAGSAAVDLARNPLRLSIAGLPSPQSSSGSGVMISDTLFVVLTRTEAPGARSGVRVSGTAFPSAVPIYLSGVSGTVYPDGSFEFKGVPPGRHAVVRYSSLSTVHQAVSVVVGDMDVDGVKLRPTTMLPLDAESDKPRSAGQIAAGTALPLASIRGRVLRNDSEEPLAEGVVVVTGYRNARRAYAIDHDGRFEIPDLLSGSYRLELGVSGYAADAQTVLVDIGDAEILFRPTSLTGTRN